MANSGNHNCPFLPCIEVVANLGPTESYALCYLVTGVMMSIYGIPISLFVAAFVLTFGLSLMAFQKKEVSPAIIFLILSVATLSVMLLQFSTHK